MCRAFARRAIAAHSGGRIVNIVFSDIEGAPRFAHAAAARAAVVNLTETLAMEWARAGILVNAVGPGTIDTEGIRQYAEEDSGRDVAGLPVPRLGTPREVALAVAYLCSPAGRLCHRHRAGGRRRRCSDQPAHAGVGQHYRAAPSRSRPNLSGSSHSNVRARLPSPAKRGGGAKC